ncbi:MAG: ABC transporter permease subunit [Clostridia bacterium]|nr:ABC transporter permease subunit [Clostridia bacterium]
MKKALKITFVILFWIGIWYLAVLIYSLFKGMSLSYNPLFPYPHHVFLKLFELFSKGSFYLSTISSLIRILISTVIAVLLGIFCAVISSRFNFLHLFIQPLLSTIKSVPVTVFVFILYLLIFDFTSMFITILMVFPIVFANVYEGIKNIDKDLLEVCQAYKIPFGKRIKSLYLPTIMPYFVSALTSSIGLAWKAGIAAEALCPPDNSMGLHISLAKQNIDNEELFAWALTLIIINLLFEFAFKKLVKAAFKKWVPNEVKNENKKSN